VRLIVSRESVHLTGGQKPCSRCARRPPVPGQRWCQPCQTEYKRNRRAGKTEMLLTPEERKMVLRARAAAADR
jgi:hypothetical protein